jgi:hypothetical protein
MKDAGSRADRVKAFFWRAFGLYGLLLVFGVGATVAQANNKLSSELSVFLQAVGLIGVAVGSAGIGLGEGRAVADQLRTEARISRVRMDATYWRWLASARASEHRRAELYEKYVNVAGTVSTTGKVEWSVVDTTLQLVLRDMDHDADGIEQGIVEWRELVPDEIAKLEAASPRTEIEAK